MTNQRIPVSEIWFALAHGGRVQHYKRGENPRLIGGVWTNQALCGLDPKKSWAQRSREQFHYPFCIKCKRAYRREVAYAGGLANAGQE